MSTRTAASAKQLPKKKWERNDDDLWWKRHECRFGFEKWSFSTLFCIEMTWTSSKSRIVDFLLRRQQDNSMKWRSMLYEKKSPLSYFVLLASILCFLCVLLVCGSCVTSDRNDANDLSWMQLQERERTRSQNHQNVPSWVEKWSLPQGDTDTTRNNVRLKGNDNNFSFPPFYPHVSWLYCILRRLYVVSVFVLNCTRLLSCLPSDSEQMRSILCVSSKNVNQNLSAFTCMNNVNMRGRNERQDRERSRLSSSSSSSLPLFPFLSDFAHRFSIIIQSTWPVNIISQNDQST